MPMAASERTMNARPLAPSLALLALAACGSSSSPPPTSPPPTPPTTISYVDPAGDGWRLVRDPASTPTRIVLDLVGPAGTPVRGVGFNLQKGTSLVFGTFADGGYAHDTGVFELTGSNANFEPYAGTDADPRLFVSGVLPSGNVLSTGIFQKDRTRVPKAPDHPVVQVAIELAPGAPAIARDSWQMSTAYALQVVKARIVPADIGGMDFILTPTVIAKAKMQDIEIAVGAIEAK